MAHTAAASLSLKVDAVDVRRAVYPPPGKGDCGEIGRVVVRFGLASGEPWPADVSLLIRHSSGHFPWFQPPVATIAAGSGWQMRATEGKVAFVGPDDPREPLDVKLEARAIDCAGEASAPVEISITDPGRPVAVKADADPADPARPLSEASEPAPPLAEPASPRPSSCSVPRAANASLGGVLASSALAMVMRRAQRRRRRR